MGKILLIWEEVPEITKLYILDEGSEIADLALKSAGKFINSDNVDEGDPVELLSEKLPGLQHLEIDQVVEGPFSKAVVCGFIM